MAEYSRRSVLKLSGTALGGIAVGTTVTAATTTERFIVDAKRTSKREAESAGLDVVHDLSPVDLLVVSGTEADVDGLGADYAPDSVYTLDRPITERTPITADEQSATDEPYYSLQWDKRAQNVSEAHEVTRGDGSRVAVIDTGVDADHPDLEHAVNTTLSRNFTADDGDYTDSGYHGTHVSGIVAANDRNEAGVVGTAPATDLVACRVFSNEGDASFADILAAIVYSAEIGCDAANLSLGAYPIARQGLGSFYGKSVNRVTTYANEEGTLLVVAAGNDSADLQHDQGVVSLPNEAAGVVSVSATGPVGFNWGDDGLESPTYTPANYTNFGTNAVDVAAPGGNYDPEFPAEYYYDLVFNAIPTWEGEYAWLAGTSMAAPQVAGAAALVASQNPDYNANQVRQALKNSAELPAEFDEAYYGAGVLNPSAALE